MYKNRITLEYIQHNSAKDSIKDILKYMDLSDDSIFKLNILSDSGYVIYTITLYNKITFSVADDGTIIEKPI